MDSLPIPWLLLIGFCTLTFLWFVGAISRSGRRRQMNQAIADRDREIEELRRALRERDQRLATIRRGLEGLDQELQDLVQERPIGPGHLKLDRRGRLREDP